MGLDKRLFVTRAQAMESLFTRWTPVKKNQSILIYEALGRVTAVEGDLLVKENPVLQPAHLCVLAIGGYEEIEVYDRPKVAYIPMGSELIPLGTSPSPGQSKERSVGHACFFNR